MTYTQLQAAVVSYLHRSDASMDTNIATFIDFARVRIGRDVQSLANLKSASVAAWSAGIGALPADLAKIRSAYYGSTVLTFIPPEQIGAFSTSTALPAVYSIEGTQSIIVPGIGAAGVVSLEYWAIPAALSAGSDVSAGMTQWPQVWVNASVLEACFWARDFETYNQMLPIYQAEVAALNKQCKDALYGAAPQIVSDQPSIQSMAIL